MLLLINVEVSIARHVAGEAIACVEARTPAHDPRHAWKLSMPSTHYTHRISAIRCVACVVASDSERKPEEGCASHCFWTYIPERAHTCLDTYELPD